MEKIYNPSSVNLLLGCLLTDSSLVVSDKYPLDKTDFCIQYQKFIYVSILNLYKRGTKNIGFMELDTYLSKYPEQYEVFKDCGGRGNIEDYIETVTELSNLDNYESYYNDVRKCSVLRDYRDNGFNIDKFFDYNKSDEENFRNVDGITTQDIISYYDGLSASIKKKFKGKRVKEEYKAGTDFAETKERFKLTPMLGNSFQSEYINDIFRGMYGFIIRCAKSGGGKSALSLGDLCQTCVLEYWDYDKEEFVINESRVGNALFINTEMNIREQLDLMIIAWISGVDRSHIADGLYKDGEEDRVDYANGVLAKSGLYIVDDPEFTASSLRTTIEDYVYNKDCKTVCHDYINNNGFMSAEISKETSIPQREDMALGELTSRMKQIQYDTGCCLLSALQTNGREDEMEYPTSSCMAGGKSQERKADGVMFMLPPTKKELEATAPILARISKSKFKIDMIPNNVCHIVKGRNSKYEKHIKVYQYADLGTSRTIDLFCTDKRNQPINVERLKIIADKK